VDQQDSPSQVHQNPLSRESCGMSRQNNCSQQSMRRRGLKFFDFGETPRYAESVEAGVSH